MDDALIERWKAGDANATTAVKNAIRSIAERVLSHSSLGPLLGPTSRARFRSDERRREATAAIAQEVMKRPPASAAQLKAAALMASCRLAIEGTQEGRPNTGEAHLPPPVAVTLALAPHSLQGRMREAADKHLSNCGACREDIRLVDGIVRTWDAADTEATREDLAGAIQGSEVEADLAAAMQAAMDESESGEVRGGSPGRAASRTPHASKLATNPASGGSSGSKTKTKAASRSAPDAESGGGKGGILVLSAAVVGLIGGVIWYFQGEEPKAEKHVVVKGAKELADRTPPLIENIPGASQDLQLARDAFAAKDCRSGAARLVKVQANPSDQPRIAVWEAGAWVCAGDGKRAQKALANATGLGASGEARWVEAQAHLLNGDPNAALDSLVLITDPSFTTKAATLMEKIRALPAN
jgi:hypothetical protein